MKDSVVDINCRISCHLFGWSGSAGIVNQIVRFSVQSALKTARRAVAITVGARYIKGWQR